MADDKYRSRIASWLREKRGARSLAEWASELGVGTTTLYRYESGERVPPLDAILRWQERFPDFPDRVVPYAARIDRDAAHLRVEEPKPVYDLGVYAQSLKRVSSAAAAVSETFAACNVPLEANASFARLLQQLLVQNNVQPDGVYALVSWYAGFIEERGVTS